MKIKAWRVALVAASLISFGVDHRDVFAVKAPPKIRQSPAGILTLSIIAPSANGKRIVERQGIGPDFQVGINNMLNNSQKVWDRGCLEGYGALTLEVVAIDGRELQKPIVMRENHDPLWTSAIYAQTMTIAPRATAVYNISLYEYSPSERSSHNFNNNREYMYFPALPIGKHTLRIQAVFQSKADQLSNSWSVWSGRIASPAQDYVVIGPYF